MTQTEIVVPPAELPKPRHLFVGVRASMATISALGATVEKLARSAKDLRWVSPTTYHVTLKYLGWVQPEITPALVDAIAAATRGVAPFAVRVRGLGAFPSVAAAKVLYAGVEPSPALADLAARIERAMVDLGFPAETRPYTPHITIARTETRPLESLVLPMSEQMFSESKVEVIALIETRTNSSGSDYSDLRKIALGTPDLAPKSTAERQTGPLDLDAQETDDGWPRGH